MKNLFYGGLKNMKKIFFALLVILFISFMYSNEEASASPNNSSAAVTVVTDNEGEKKESTKTFTGKVDALSVASDNSKINSQIMLKGDDGSEVVFVIPKGVSVTDKNGKAIGLGWIGKDDKACVEYTIAQNGVKIAKSIKKVSNF